MLPAPGVFSGPQGSPSWEGLAQAHLFEPLVELTQGMFGVGWFVFGGGRSAGT